MWEFRLRKFMMKKNYVVFYEIYRNENITGIFSDILVSRRIKRI
jgi:hypothetical protein